MNLVIVESPTKAKTINRFLGKNYKVTSSMGHLIDLPRSQLGVDTENNFAVKYITIRGKGKTLAELRRLAKKANRVFLATDPDREGEAIAWHLLKAFKLEQEASCRVVFNQITRPAIKEAFKNPRPLDYKLIDAQQARRVLDRLVGYKISPLLWAKVRKGLSAGRVQSAALNMLCQRQDEIDKFEPREYWSIEIDFVVGNAVVRAKLSRIDDKKAELHDEQQTKAVAEKLAATSFMLVELANKERKKNPSPPFITSTLQQEAGKKLGFSARKTMAIAQQLYEGITLGRRGSTGLITYMRTDSVSVAPEFLKSTQEFIKDTFGAEYVPQDIREFANRRGAQAAHEAIRPTDLHHSPEAIKEFLSREQFSLYQLIWQRFIASQMAVALYRQQTLTFSGGPYQCKASIQVLVFPGFLAASGGRREETNRLIAPELKGSKTPVQAIDPQQHFTQPPPLYNEALLVKEMEKMEIGRPSTYAPTIETLLQRAYVEKEGGRLVPTELGKVVNQQLTTFFPEILDLDFTASLESRLDTIAEGKVNWKDVIADFYAGFKQAVDKAATHMESLEIPDEESDVRCEYCGRKMVIKSGRFGKFLACPGYPECKNTKPYQESLGIKCPQCGGEIVRLRTRRGRIFYGCKNYPHCTFRSWKQPVEETCPRCNYPMAIEKKNLLGCLNPQCDYKQAREKDGHE